MRAHMLEVQGAAGHGLQPRAFLYGSRNVQLCVTQVGYPWREAKSEHVHQREHMVVEADRVLTMLLDAQIRLVVKQPVEHIG